jgi:hypothetical protein
LRTISYSEIENQFILSYQFLKIVIFEETKHLFEEQPNTVNKWCKEAYEMTKDEFRNHYPPNEMSQSFKALYIFFTEELYPNRHITKFMIKEGVQRYSEIIYTTVSDFIYNNIPEEVHLSLNEKTIDETLQQDYIFTSMDNDYNMIRNIVAKKSKFKKTYTGDLAADLIDTKGNFRGMAELRPKHNTHITLKKGQEDLWMKLVDSTYNALDEWTADLFDLITYLWLVSPKNEDGYIEFHSDNALRLKQLQDPEDEEGLVIRERDRFNIMKRVVTLLSMWVSLTEGKLVTEESKEYDFQDFQRMFDIGSIRVAYDKNTGEAKGIYAVQLKPASILTPLINASSQMIGLLHIKVFQYSHKTQKEHKRLLRYLDRQWKMRIRLKSKMTQPFKISTLLKEMDIAIRYNWSQKKDKLENVLDDFKADGVIKDWEYTESFDESLVGKKNWHKIWHSHSIIIYPTDIVITENQKGFSSYIKQDHKNLIEHVNHQTQDSMIEDSSPKIPELLNQTPEPVKEKHFEQQSFNFTPDEIVLSPEIMKKTMTAMNMSIRQTAEEIGIAHTTLSRYLRNENKRQNNKNGEKMLNWLKGKTLTN